jgi:hypothetical protein
VKSKRLVGGNRVVAARPGKVRGLGVFVLCGGFASPTADGIIARFAEVRGLGVFVLCGGFASPTADGIIARFADKRQ